MELRTPDIEEYESIVGLWAECGVPYRPEGRDSRAHVAEELAARPEYWPAAYENENENENDRLVGVAVGTDDGRKGWVNRLAVRPDRRREGIATALVDALEDAFDANGLPVVAALVEADNAASAAFFADRGYDDAPLTYYSKREHDRV
jgi:GNAT superfamily N-acetyltransferase